MACTYDFCILVGSIHRGVGDVGTVNFRSEATFCCLGLRVELAWLTLEKSVGILFYMHDGLGERQAAHVQSSHRGR